jgi:dihydropteroate synthase
MYTLNCKGKLLVLDKPLIMGILNITPDSFYEGHIEKSLEEMISMAKKMIGDGADIIDIGGQSTKPGSGRISAAEELKRVLPVIQAINERSPGTVISIDTYYSEVAIASVQAGASIVNDISAGSMDDQMIPAVASLQVPYIAMHMKGTPETMQQEPHYEDVVKEVLDFFIRKIGECEKAGIHDVIIDPGFGFGKTIQHNFQLLKNLALFKMLSKPVLAGLSRKATVYKTLHTSPAEALNGTTCVNSIAVLNGAGILRVHDVREAKEVVTLLSAYQDAS